MRKKWRIGAVVLLAVLVGGGVLWALFLSGGPRYAGRTVGYWLRADAAWDGPLALPKPDSNAVPVLIKALNKRDGTTDRIYVWIWNKSPTSMKKRLPAPVPDYTIRRRAMIWLRELGPQARPAIPALAQVLKNPKNGDLRWGALFALEALDPNNPAVRAARIDISTNSIRW